ncbi:MAG: polysaccharide deacetylase family protein, partial [Ignavibacteriaceae bacterium]
KSAGIVYGTYGKGRFVWMGFELNSILGNQDDYIYFDRFFQNSIHWLTYTPIAYVRDWPKGYNAAAIITPVLSNEEKNIQNLFKILSEENIKATFFVESKKVNQFPDLIRSLPNYGEIAAIVDIGYLSAANDTLNKLDDAETQTKKFISAKNNLEAATQTKIFGALPYYGLYNQNTFKGLINAGYQYVFTDSLTDRSVPKTIIRGDNRIFAMTKTARDDYEVIRDFHLNDVDFQRYTYQEDIDRILFEGGMYVYKIHTDYQCRPENISVVKDIIENLKSKKFWITTANEVQKWYAKRSFIELRVDRRGNRRVAFTISNPGKKNVDQLVIEVDMNVDAKNISLSSEMIRTKMVKYKFNNFNRILYVYVDELGANESRTYYIDYDRPNA